MITVTKLQVYLYAMYLKRNRIYYRLKKIEKLPYKAVGLEKLKLMYKSIYDVIHLLKTFHINSLVSVDSYGNYNIQDLTTDKIKYGKFNSILGGMQV